MSNYHYNDQRNRPNCLQDGSYSTLEGTQTYNCDIPCLCRFSDERSDMDKIYYDWFVLNKPMVLPVAGQPLSTPKNNNCAQK